MNLLRYLHILPLSHSVINVIASLTLSETRKYWQQILTPTVEPLHLASPQGYEVTQCSNVLWFSLCFDCSANKYSGAMRAKSPCYYYNSISNGRVQQRQAVTIFAKVFPFQKYVRECNKETLIVVPPTYRGGDNPCPMIHHNGETGDERCRTSNMKHCVSKIQTEAITVKKCRSAHCKLYTIQSLGADYKGRTQTVKGSQCQTLPLENNWISFDMLGHDLFIQI